MIGRRLIVGDEFLYLCEYVGYRVKVESEKLNAFMLV